VAVRRMAMRVFRSMGGAGDLVHGGSVVPHAESAMA
jgi:hypothetical protein